MFRAQSNALASPHTACYMFRIQVCGPAAPRSWPKRIPLKALRRGSPLFESGYAPTHAGKPSEIEPSAHIAAWTRVKKLGVARCLSGGKGCIPTAD